MTHESDNAIHRGGCLCGAVRYRITGPLRPVINCHCQQCRRTSGHFVAATQCPQSALQMDGDSLGLKWFHSSQEAKRGFCSQCGSSLFWTRVGSQSVSVMAGTLDQAEDLQTSRHIYVADKGDYYQLNDGLPQES